MTSIKYILRTYEVKKFPFRMYTDTTAQTLMVLKDIAKLLNFQAILYNIIF